MPENKTPAPQKQKKTFLQKVGSFFRSLPKRVATPFMNTWRELRKVTWPTRKDLMNYTLVVLVFMVFMGIVIGLLDLGSSELVKLFIAGKAA